MAKNQVRILRQTIDGVLLLDKPVGWSSNDALIKVKRLFNAKKAGHTGTLDPFATGLLPLCFGEATKFAQDLLDADKSYEAVVHLGIRTTTGDTEGDVLEMHAVEVTQGQIDAALQQFTGEIDQIPPMYSALKREGKPLYEYARAGITLDRAARRVLIHTLECVQYNAPYLNLRVTCSKGTYIRVLGEDIGTALGCGAHLQALRRTQVGNLSLTGALTVDAIIGMPELLRNQSLAPVDALLSSLPAVYLLDPLSVRYLQGQRLSLGKEGVALPTEQGRIRVYRQSDGQLLGTGVMAEFGVLAPERLISTHLSC
ncbi:MAG: tRNA pseudouridine(55) synthase TruB [Glaciimonas sp.]|nr:tRNA pseudouridine(55) synthase TruB [Glaciimonas sp.]